MGDPNITIPEEAWDAVVKAVPIDAVNAAKGSAWDINDLQQKAVEAAAPLIVAAANEQAVQKLMVLAQKIVTQASQASRAGQMDELEAIASEVADVARGLRVGSLTHKEGETT